MRVFTSIILLLLLCFTTVFAQRTVGLVDYDVPNTDGYVLFSPISSTHTYLINKCGEKVHEWSTSTFKPGLSNYLLNDGNLLRAGDAMNHTFSAGGGGGVIEKFDWDGNLVWQYFISDTMQCQHHDVRQLPNGNVLAIVWDNHVKVDAINNGRNPAQAKPNMWSEKIVELQPVGIDSAVIVWQWRVWDHLVQQQDSTKPNYGVIANHPELININAFYAPPTSFDWLHFNGLDYNPDLDQIIVNTHNMGEIWIIDHSTSMAEASGHTGGRYHKGGDLLYRWGNPMAYGRGVLADKKLYGEHHPTWIPQGYPNAGKIIVFNNGLNRPAGAYSSVDIIDQPVDSTGNYSISGSAPFGPDSAMWSYTAPNPTDFYSSNISGVYPLANGSFLITNGQFGVFFEIDSAKNTVWKYINPVNNTIYAQGDTPGVNQVFRSNFYPPDYAGLSGRSLTSLGEIELNPLDTSLCDLLSVGIGTVNAAGINLYPNPTTAQLKITGIEGPFTIELVNTMGQVLLITENTETLNLDKLPAAQYLVNIITPTTKVHRSIIKL